MRQTNHTKRTEPSDPRLRRLTRELHARNAAADQLDAARKHAQAAEASFSRAARHLQNGRRITALLGTNNGSEMRAALKAVIEARAEFRTATRSLLSTAARLRKTLPQERRLTDIIMGCLAGLHVESEP